MKVSLFLVALVALVGAASANCMQGIFYGTQGSRESALISAACSAGLRGDELRQFMAQCAHECAHFNTMEEYASGAAYEGRRDLGNTQPGDGRRYKGRGYIQLTGRANYRTFGRALGLDLEGNPNLALQPAVAAKVALKYWKDRVRPRVSNFCNTRDATYYINGGSNGLSDREKYFRKYGGCGGTSSGGGSTNGGGSSSKCSGKCINVQAATCGSTPKTGLCPGSWNIQCCTSSVFSSCSVCVKNGGGKGCVNGACSSASYSCKICLNNFGGRGCQYKCSSSFDELDTDILAFDEDDEADQSVGSPFGNGQSGRGPSPFDPSQGWWDEADQSVGNHFDVGRGGKCSNENFSYLEQENLKHGGWGGDKAAARRQMIRFRPCAKAIFKKMCSGCGYDINCYQRNGHKYRTPATLPSQCNYLKYDEADQSVGRHRRLFKAHGRWCGPNWTNGRKISAENYMRLGGSFNAYCIDEADCACRYHDYQCAMAGRCCKSHDRLLIKRLKGTDSPWISSAMRVASWTRSC